MNRITIQQIKDGYEKTKLIPIHGCYKVSNDKSQIVAGCALTACAWAIRPVEVNRFAEILDITPSYMYGFALGFDGITPMDCDFKDRDRDEVLTGHEDVAAARAEIQPNAALDSLRDLPGVAFFDFREKQYVFL